jgi:hypothetical protein
MERMMTVMRETAMPPYPICMARLVSLACSTDFSPSSSGALCAPSSPSSEASSWWPVELARP